MSAERRTLTVVCNGGLANRLRVLFSGATLADATGRDFQMIWPVNDACAAPFERLFISPWTVRATDVLPGRRIASFASMRRDGTPDLLASTERDLALAEGGSLFSPEDHAHHAPYERAAEALIDRLRPVAALQQRVDAFVAAHFADSMIGVHLRRGDFVRRRPDVVANTSLAIAAVDRLLGRTPSARILLCTDDGGPDQVTGRTPHEDVRRRFKAKYGDRVAWTEGPSLDRRDPGGVDAAVVDLWLLRRTHVVVGSTGSSFSQLAVMHRDVEIVYCGGPTATYARLERVVRAGGVEPLLSRLPFAWRLGTRPSLAALWWFYRSLPGAAVRRVMRKR